MIENRKNILMTVLQKNAIMVMGEQFAYTLIYAFRDEINAAETMRQLHEIDERYTAIIERMRI